MAFHEAWVKFAGLRNAVKFPQDVEAFEGFMIATFAIDQARENKRRRVFFTLIKQKVITGGRDLRPGMTIVLKGNLPSLHPAFRYCLRFKHKLGSAGNEYEILPRAGLRNSQRLPWTAGTLSWSLANEIETSETNSGIRDMIRLVVPPGSGDDYVVTEEVLKQQPDASFMYEKLLKKSDYYRLRSILSVRKAWPTAIKEIREMDIRLLDKLSAHLSSAPHELCFYAHSKEYGLGEMSYPVLLELLEEARTSGLVITTKPLDISAACFYGHLKELRNRFGHTIFSRKGALEEFRRKNPPPSKHGAVAVAAVYALVRGGHLLFLDKAAVAVTDEARWFVEKAEDEVLVSLQFPRDDQLKERIVGHLRRIYTNFLAAEGKFTLRPPESFVPATPGGPLNERQRDAMMHIIHNPFTIIQASVSKDTEVL
jgi:hypothetical protein